MPIEEPRVAETGDSLTLSLPDTHDQFILDSEALRLAGTDRKRYDVNRIVCDLLTRGIDYDVVRKIPVSRFSDPDVSRYAIARMNDEDLKDLMTLMSA